MLLIVVSMCNSKCVYVNIAHAGYAYGRRMHTMTMRMTQRNMNNMIQYEYEYEYADIYSISMSVTVSTIIITYRAHLTVHSHYVWRSDHAKICYCGSCQNLLWI